MKQFSIAPHQQNPNAWFERPPLVLFLPYSVRTASFALDAAAMHLLFTSNGDTWRLVDAQGLGVTVQRRYDVAPSGGRLRIHGPYGYKAWTMVTLITMAFDGNRTLLTFRTFPHRSIVLGMLVMLVFTCIFAAGIGVPAAPWFPLLFFGPFLYAATVIATKIEAAAIVALVRQAAEDAALTRR